MINYERYPEYYDKKFFRNNRESKWLPYAKCFWQDKQELLNFYEDNQEFIESYKKVIDSIHMGWVYMMFAPDECVTDEGNIEECATYKNDSSLNLCDLFV